MPVTPDTFKRLALEDPDSKWELWHGCLRKKEPMTSAHYDASFEMAYAIRSQVDRLEFQVRCDQSQVTNPAGYFIPDVCVVPTAQLGSHWLEATELEVLAAPLPFVAEVWSRSTGAYDRNEKLQQYQARGDLEIWLVHPYEHWVARWLRQDDGSYAESRHTNGVLDLAFVPGVHIDLGQLFLLEGG